MTVSRDVRRPCREGRDLGQIVTISHRGDTVEVAFIDIERLEITPPLRMVREDIEWPPGEDC